MIKLIVGHKGSGKTKTMIAMANEAASSSKGNVVCVEKGIQLTYDLSHAVRLVDIEEYGVDCYASYYGFLCGLMAGNYDITHVFCDALFKVCGKDMVEFEKMVNKLDAIAVKTGTQLVLTVSCDAPELPESIKALAL